MEEVSSKLVNLMDITQLVIQVFRNAWVCIFSAVLVIHKIVEKIHVFTFCLSYLQTWGIDPMLIQYWSTVYNTVPT